MGRLRQHLSYANVVATLALFVALGGASYAALKLPHNSVKSKQIARGAVKRSDLGANAVDSSKVKDGKLRARDFAAGQLPAGPPGQDGAPGAPGSALGYARVLSSFPSQPTLDSANTKNVTGVSYGGDSSSPLFYEYCFSLPFHPHGVVATLQPSGVTTAQNYAAFGGAGHSDNCPADHDDAHVEVYDYMHTGAVGSATYPFFVLFE
ncbi:MAG: hypothetical protein QOG63_326 [Thermoleophilaceae bacterium]|jgi:hypothetical protein|nr:hypothetical protein [Thermoleophilaceae bacterium]